MEYAVLGGGALGLMAAYRLAQAGQSVMIFEQEQIAERRHAIACLSDDRIATHKRADARSIAANHHDAIRVRGDRRVEQIQVWIRYRPGLQQCVSDRIDPVPAEGRAPVCFCGMNCKKHVADPVDGRAYSRVTIVQRVGAVRLLRVYRRRISRHRNHY